MCHVSFLTAYFINLQIRGSGWKSQISDPSKCQLPNMYRLQAGPKHPFKV